MRQWSIEIYLLDEKGNELPANCYNKAVYNLHPTFKNPVQTIVGAPFKCTNEGWGEFEMTIDLFTTEKGGKTSIRHDLNFQQPTYEVDHTVTFKNPSQVLQALLRESGPLPGDEDRKKKADGPAAGASVGGGGVGGGASKKSSRKSAAPIDVEKMATALTHLEEEDILIIIQMIHDNKSDDTYIKNDIDAGEFSVDLLSLSESCLKMIWDYIELKGHA